MPPFTQNNGKKILRAYRMRRFIGTILLMASPILIPLAVVLGLLFIKHLHA